MKDTILDRAFLLKSGREKKGPIVYWMSRDQRTQDNWALLFSQEKALEQKVPLMVVFCLVPTFLHATIRHYSFLLRGLKEVEEKLAEKGIPFILLTGEPGREIPALLKETEAGLLVTDFDPLIIKRDWKEAVAEKTNIPFYEVDSHNIIPCRIASPKQEYSARTFRPKAQKLLPRFLTDIPSIRKQPYREELNHQKTDWESAMQNMPVDRSVREVSGIIPGEGAAKKALRRFLQKGLLNYSRDRNNPVADGQSDLSPYLHFGQLSAQRVAWEVMKSDAPQAEKEAFLEELIVRRELADNFCFYNPLYNSFACFPRWAQDTLNAHRKDRREYLYTTEELEAGKTHDELWNAAQLEMVQTGKMHGYMRIYWAKKILEWTESPEKALTAAIHLNDRYELDGRDPNGYTGIAWSIGGLHDRPWPERKIFGKIRYMSYNGCRSKFDVEAYIRRVQQG